MEPKGKPWWGGVLNSGELDRAIQSLELTIERTSLSSPRHPKHLRDLAVLLRRRYITQGDPDDLDKAIDCMLRAGDRFADPLEIIGRLNNLSILLRDRFALRGDSADLNNAIEGFRKVSDETPVGSDDWLRAATNLGTALVERYDLKGHSPDLDEGITALNAAVALTSRTAPELPLRLGNLGNALRAKHALTGHIPLLMEAVDVLARAASTCAPGSPEYPRLLSNLGSALLDVFDRGGGVDVVKSSVALLRAALAKTPVTSPEASGRMVTLGNALRRLYHSAGDLLDLEEGIDTLSAAASRTVAGEAVYYSAVVSWAGALHDRYHHLREPADLDVAIKACADALEHAVPDQAERVKCLNGYSAGLQLRYGVAHNPEDLNAAIAAAEETLSLTPATSPRRYPRVANAATAYLSRFQSEAAEVGDLDRAVDLFEEAVSAVSSEFPDLPAYLSNLATGLKARFDRDGDPEDLHRGIDAFRRSCSDGVAKGHPWVIQAARNWARWAADRAAWAEAVEAWSFGIEAARQLYSVQVIRPHKEVRLQEAQDLHVEAAFAMMMNGDAKTAATTLENGRALFLSERLTQDHRRLLALQESHPHFVDQLKDLLEHISALEEGDQSTPAGRVSRWAALRQARADLASTFDLIREIPGWESFLSPATYDDIVAAATEEPLVYLAAASRGGFSLIVSSGEVFPIVHPLATAAAMREKILNYMAEYYKVPRTASWIRRLDDLTHWLWDVLVESLIEALPTGPPLPRAKLIPMGLLGYLPLHAAWKDDPIMRGGRRYALDDLLLTYVPSARALLTARTALEARGTAESMLVVDAFTSESAERPLEDPPEVGPAYTTFQRQQWLHDDRLTREAVMSAFSKYSVLHFACHGVADVVHPLRSTLFISNDEQVTLSDLKDNDLKARLVILAACESAVPGIDLPDEVVSFPTALLEAGAGAAIGSLWEVPHYSTTMLMRRFYELWRLHDDVEPAEALRQAQLELRDSLLSDSSLAQAQDGAHILWHWAAFSYVGA